MEKTPLASLSLTHVHYVRGCCQFRKSRNFPGTDSQQNPEDPLSYLSAWLALMPQALCVAYVTLIWASREAEVILMFVGQMGCEALNFVLKRIIREERPKGRWAGVTGVMQMLTRLGIQRCLEKAMECRRLTRNLLLSLPST